MEVIQADREDVAAILLKTHKANLDISDCDGYSPRSLALSTTMGSKVAGMISRAAAKETRAESKSETFKCSNCGKKETKTKKSKR